MTGMDARPLRPRSGQWIPNPTEIVQNPVLGAGALSNATRAFGDECGEAFPVLLAFLVLPMVFHGPTREAIGSTRAASGLAKLGSKFKGHEDALMAIHLRALGMRSLTLDSIGLAVAGALVAVDYTAGTMRQNVDAGLPPQHGSAKAVLDATTKLGAWLARVSLTEIADTLRVEF